MLKTRENTIKDMIPSMVLKHTHEIMKNKIHISVFFLGGSEIERNSLMALPGDGGHSGIMP